MLSISLLTKSFHGCRIAGNASRLGLSSLEVDRRPGVLQQGFYGCQPLLASLATKAEDPKPMKRPVSGFLAFANERRPDYKIAHPGTSSRIIQKVMAEEWKKLSEDRRKHYETTFTEKMVLYKAAEEQWWSKLTDEQKQVYLKTKREIKESVQKRRMKRQVRQLGKPTKVRSPFNFYIAEQMKQMLKPTPGVNQERQQVKVGTYFNSYWAVIKGAIRTAENSQIREAKLPQVSFTSATKNWKTLSDEDRQKYTAMSDKDKLRYVSENEAWNLRMMKEGHGKEIQEGQKKPRTIKRNNMKAEGGQDEEIEPKPARKPRSSKTKSEA